MRSFNLSSPVHATWVRSYLCDGGVVACAAEGVWGLSCDPFNPDGVRIISRLKKRTSEKGYILVSGELRHFEHMLRGLNPMQLQAIEQNWPGTSYVFPDTNRYYPSWVAIPSAISGQSVALRLTCHPQLVQLSQLLDTPVVSTSANLAGLKPAMSPQQVVDYFGNDLVCIASELIRASEASSLIDLVSGDRLR